MRKYSTPRCQLLRPEVAEIAKVRRSLSEGANDWAQDTTSPVSIFKQGASKRPVLTQRGTVKSGVQTLGCRMVVGVDLGLPFLDCAFDFV
jgi:hypothetical protein